MAIEDRLFTVYLAGTRDEIQKYRARHITRPDYTRERINREGYFCVLGEILGGVMAVNYVPPLVPLLAIDGIVRIINWWEDWVRDISKRSTRFPHFWIQPGLIGTFRGGDGKHEKSYGGNSPSDGKFA